jgi:hypothetical protein
MELRHAISPVRAMLGMRDATYTDGVAEAAGPAYGRTIGAFHLTETRAALR